MRTSQGLPGLTRKGLRTEASDWILIGCVVGSTMLRLVYGLFVMDPLSGPDGLTYHTTAVAIRQHGIFAQGADYWPAGYPAFLAGIYVVTGTSLRAATAIQTLLFGGAMLVTHRLVARELGAGVALLTVVLMAISPALLASPTMFMYESLLAVGLVIGFDQLSRSAQDTGWRAAALGSAVLGLTATLQPKVLAAAALGLGWLAWRRREGAVVAVGLALLIVGPSLLVMRNVVAHGVPAMSGNLGVNVAMGFQDAATGGYTGTIRYAERCGASSDTFERDRQMLRCAAEWVTEHPLAAVAGAVPKTVNFLSPMTGPHARRGTWYHAFDVRRLLPGPITEHGAAQRLVAWGSTLWTVLTAAAIGWGAFTGLRHARTRSGTVLLLLPLLAFYGITLLTFGDARFRLPAAPFYSALIALGALSLAHRVRRPPRQSEAR